MVGGNLLHGYDISMAQHTVNNLELKTKTTEARFRFPSFTTINICICIGTTKRGEALSDNIKKDLRLLLISFEWLAKKAKS